MKFIITVLVATFLMANNYALSGPLDKLERKLDRLFGKEIESGSDVKAAKKKKNEIQRRSKQIIIKP